MILRKTILLLLGFITLPTIAIGETKVSISPSGYLYWEFGIYDEMQGDQGDGGAVYKDQFFQSTTGGLSLGIEPHPRLKIRVTQEARTFNYLPKRQSPLEQEAHKTQFETIIEEANAALKLGDLDNPAFLIQAGLFLHKYNPDAKALGEYLMRSMPYPNLLFTKFDYAKTKLLGIRIAHKVNNIFKHEIILNSEYHRSPLHDFSLGYITNITLLDGFINMGGGVDFHHLLPVRPSLTTPKVDENLAVSIPAQQWIDDLGTVHSIPYDTFYIMAGIPDSLKDTSGTLHANIARESDYLSYKGLKLMGRITLDPKALLNLSFLGPEDLKFYAEAAVLGWKNYPVFYQNRRERIPVMVGFNIPAFKILDVLSLEIEHNPSRIPGSYRTSANLFYPHAGTSQFSALFLPEDYVRDDWKWMIYARRGFFNQAFQLIGQIGLDHNRFQDVLLPDAYQEASINPDQWYYQLRLKASY